MENNNERVLYMQCPHCRKGWFGKVKDFKVGYKQNEKTQAYDEFVEKCVIEGINDTDICQPITCLNCGHEYIPGVECDNILFMDPWVAHMVTTIKGEK